MHHSLAASFQKCCVITDPIFRISGFLIFWKEHSSALYIFNTNWVTNHNKVAFLLYESSIEKPMWIKYRKSGYCCCDLFFFLLSLGRFQKRSKNRPDWRWKPNRKRFTTIRFMDFQCEPASKANSGNVSKICCFAAAYSKIIGFVFVWVVGGSTKVVYILMKWHAIHFLNATFASQIGF